MLRPIWGLTSRWHREVRGVECSWPQSDRFDGTSEVTFTLATDRSSGHNGNSGYRFANGSHRRDRGRDQGTRSMRPDCKFPRPSTAGVLQLRGLSDRVDPETALAFAASGSITGNPLNDAFKITNYSLDVVLTDALLNAVDGSTITIFDGE